MNELLGSDDAVLVADSSRKILYSKHADRKLIPASILKIFTSLFATNSLGKDYRFKTEFYVDKDHNLKVKGFGDPLLTSEVLDEIAGILAGQLDSIKDIVIDDSYFANPIIIPGTLLSSTQPYDAPIGALSVNFNTVNFKRSKNGNFVSAEPQTPLLPFIIPRIKATSLHKGRIMLERDEIAPYAGHLIRWFLINKGITLTGKVKKGIINGTEDKLVLRYMSKNPTEDMIRQLLLFSNNFIANQMLITSGAEIYGPPGTMEKGIKAARQYAEDVLNIKKQELDIKEGSGISRQNRISANTFLKVLHAFEPYRHLMRKDKTVFYKTGNLDGISTRAGYIESDEGSMYYYIIMLNTPGKSSKMILKKIIPLAVK
jgi:serine-type D-Ala-D-Ala carboxypeptidase/endopeptidase (penicillin-binding protein 4)